MTYPFIYQRTVCIWRLLLLREVRATSTIRLDFPTTSETSSDKDLNQSKSKIVSLNKINKWWGSIFDREWAMVFPTIMFRVHSYNEWKRWRHCAGYTMNTRSVKLTSESFSHQYENRLHVMWQST